MLRDVRTLDRKIADFPTKGHFASYAGTAPVEATSGEVVRHRLSMAGNRKLNYALYMVALCQVGCSGRHLLPQEAAQVFAQGKALLFAETHDRGARGDVVHLTFWQPS